MLKIMAKVLAKMIAKVMEGGGEDDCKCDGRWW